MACISALTKLVVVVGIELHLELLTGLNESFGEHHGVLDMHVVVGHAVDEQQFAPEVAGTAGEVAGIVSAEVDLRTTHEALGIARV